MSHDRSGSTLLRIVLDTHPEIACPGELVVARAVESLLYVVDNSIGLTNPDLRGPEGAPARALEVRRIINGIMREYAKGRGKSVWCEKWPGGSRIVGAIERVFPDARFICLYRDCLDTIDSCVRAYGRYGFSTSIAPHVAANPRKLMVAVGTSWLEESRRILELEQRAAGRCHRVRYEDLVTDPAGTLEPMFGFLGLDWDPAIITRTFEVQHDHPGTKGDEGVTYRRTFDASALGAGAARVPLEQLNTDLIERINAVSKTLGYEPVQGRRVAKAVKKTRRTVVSEAIDLLVAQVFTKQLPENLKARSAQLAGQKGVIEFVITDGVPRRWWVSFQGGEVVVSNDPQPAGCTVILDQTQFLEIAAGRLKIIEAQRGGEIGFIGEGRLIGVMGYFFG